jgi:hypothetical protein
MKKVSRKKLEKKDTSFTTWKIQLENTVNADPQTDGACLQILRAYLDFMGSPDARPYLSILHLKVATSLHEGAIVRARRKLIKLGYFIADGTTSAGAVRYKIVNSRESLVLDHKTVSREKLKLIEAEKKEKERKKRSRPAEVAGHVSSAEIAGLDAIQICGNRRDRSADFADNYVYNSVEAISMEEGEYLNGDTFVVDIRVENIKSEPPQKIGPSLENAYLAAARGDDPDEPLPIPESDDEAESMMDAICEGCSAHPVVRNRLRSMLMDGLLTSNRAKNILGARTENAA